MSSYMVVSIVSETLRDKLFHALSSIDDNTISQIFPDIDHITFKNPTDTARDNAHHLSLWLYQITENEHLKNQPMTRANGPESLQYPPLALNLHYLITPFTRSHSNDRDDDHIVLGKVMQFFHDNSIITLQDNANGIAEELHIIFARLSLEELTRIWEALREPYRLSICYRVQVLRIDSTRVTTQARVVDRALADREGGAATLRE